MLLIHNAQYLLVHQWQQIHQTLHSLANEHLPLLYKVHNQLFQTCLGETTPYEEKSHAIKIVLNQKNFVLQNKVYGSEVSFTPMSNCTIIFKNTGRKVRRKALEKKGKQEKRKDIERKSREGREEKKERKEEAS